MADVVVRSCGFRVIIPSCCRALTGARHLRTAANMHKAFSPSFVKLNTKEKFMSVSTGCASCTRIRHLSSPSSVAIPSQVITAKSTEVQKSKKYQPLHVMPFSLAQGGKCIAHVLQKHKPKRALVFVRAKVLAVELAKELEEYGIKCTLPKYEEKVDDDDSKSDGVSPEESTYMYSLYPVKMDIEPMNTDILERQSVDRQAKDGQSNEGQTSERLETVDKEANLDVEPSITVLTEDDVQSMDDLLPVDLIILVQQPMSGRSFTLFCLKKTHIKAKPLDVVLLYGNNDIPFLREIQTYVDVKKLVPPSFYAVSVMTEGLPSVQEETSTVLPGRHLIEPPQPAITATIPPKVLPFVKFTPPVPVPTKRPERHGLDDRARIYVRGGGGGQGSPRFGGMGGDGGDVIVQCLPYGTLSHFTEKENRRVIAEQGTSFRIDEKGRKHRAIRGRDVVIPVPVGTTLSLDDDRIIGELDEIGDKIVVAKGGRGGSAATVNWCGEKGERGSVRLEMKMHSDVALVGFPNAGKSTLLGAISNASPKIADYAFTTMRPSIGMVEYSDHSQLRVADLPGLIEGASFNRGLGHAFLKHTEKAKALALVVDIDGFHFNDKFPARTAFENVCILLKEIFLYKRELLNRPKMLIVTKLDKKGATSTFNALRHKLDSIHKHETLRSVLEEISLNGSIAQENTNLIELTEELASTSFESIVPFSAVTSFGLEDLRDKIRELLNEDRV